MKRNTLNMKRGMLKNVFTFTVAILCFFNRGWSQNIIVPPSPTSEKFIQYHSLPASNSYGNVDISIPFTDLKNGDIKLSVGLNYKTDGIKYDESIGEIGLGWILSSNYRVSREINGFPDESTTFFSSFQDSLNVLYTNNLLRDRFLANFVNSNQVYPSKFGRKNWDADYDIFSYITPEGSGQFILDPVSRQPIVMSGSRLYKIEIDIVANDIKGFKVISDTGIKYFFGTDNSTGDRYIEEVNGTEMFGMSKSSWMIYRIEDLNNNFIRFSYDKYNVYPKNIRSNYVSYRSMSYNQSSSKSAGFSNSPYYGTYYLKEINTSNNIKIELKRISSSDYKLDYISLFQRSSLLRKMILGRNGSFLKTAKIFDGNSVQQGQGYILSYNRESEYASIIASSIPDYWGYYKLLYGSVPPSTNIPRFWYSLYCDFSGSFTNMFTNSLDALLTDYNRDRTVTDDSAIAFSLNTVQFPTGGVLRMGYESSLHDNKRIGIRLKYLSNGEGNLRDSIVYSYEGSHIEYDIANQQYYVKESVYGFVRPPYTQRWLGRSMQFNDKLSSDLQKVYNEESPVRYSKVTENYYVNQSYKGATQFEYSTFQRYSFSTFGGGAPYKSVGRIFFSSNYMGSNGLMCSTMELETSPRQFPDFFVSTNYLGKEINLLKKTDFKYENSILTPVKRETYNYQQILTPAYNSLKVRLFLEGESTENDGVYSFSGLDSYFSYGTSSLYGCSSTLVSKQTETFDGTAPLEESVIYSYNNDQQLISQTLSTSDGRNRKDIFVYPANYLSGVAWIDNLISRNVRSPFLEKVSTIDGKVVAGIINIYNSNSLLQTVSKLKLSQPVALSLFKFSNRVLGVEPPTGTLSTFSSDSRYAKDYEIISYNNYSKPQELKKLDDAITVYLWGYGGQYPIIEIKNATYAEVVSVLTQATIDNLNSISQTEATMESLIKAASDKLRSDSRLAKAMVTTYTYKPLVGMTSKTDARGIKETYTYDGMQRLQAVLDHLNYVNRSFDYHYRSN
ncbi:hypothetical protein ACR79N_00485 [Sphingobacterium siyangense]|uniref:YD repeat-containing protein n=1 Tax=Sphingobacterium siyangense TaxID=459529 RepID=A0A562MCM6_9SPHI|nr:hypothetical protein [Sphingobacterium siyangense]TWI17659.1 hypothetical protein IQ31_03545 [Sphingobacterium siyangense]